MAEEQMSGSVVMLNLLRFRPGGREGYRAYAAAAQPFLQRYGAGVLYAGEGAAVLEGDTDQAWDAVVIVRFPSWDSVQHLAADPGYQALAQSRTLALDEAVLQATTPWF